MAINTNRLEVRHRERKMRSFHKLNNVVHLLGDDKSAVMFANRILT